MAVLKAKLFERRGEIAPLSAVILLVGVLILTIALQVNHSYATIDLLTGKTNQAVLAVAASNVDKVHDGVREGQGTARSFNGSSWSRLVTTEAVIQSLQVSLDATRSGATLTRENGVQLVTINTKADNYDGGKLNFTTTMTIKIPLSLGGGILPPLQHKLVVHTTYEPKF